MSTAPDERADDAPWLDGEETDTWLALVRLTLQVMKPVESDLRRDSELTLFEYMVLGHLSMSPERSARMCLLAQLTNGSATRLSNVVSRFERNGWVTRSTDPDDRRGAIAHLTEAGFGIVEQAAPGHVRSVREHIIDRLDPEQRAGLRSIATTLRSAEDC